MESMPDTKNIALKDEDDEVFSSQEEEEDLHDSDYEYEYVDLDLRDTAKVVAGRKTTGLLEEDSIIGLQNVVKDELGLGEQCLQCKREKHSPVHSCQVMANWLALRHQLPTFAPAVLMACCQRFIQGVSDQFRGLSLTEAALLCTSQNWDHARFLTHPVHVAALEQEQTIDDPQPPPDEDDGEFIDFDEDEEMMPVPDRPAPPNTLAAATTAAARLAATAAAITAAAAAAVQERPIARAASATKKQAVAATTNGTSCPICLDEDIESTDMISMECQHAFCRSCWRGLIESMLDEGLEAALQTTCPINGCRQPVTETQVRYMAPDLLPKYQSRQLESFVQGNAATLRWCPGPDCGWIAVKPTPLLFEDNIAHFLCNHCQTSFCFDCGNPPHDGACPRDVEENPDVARAPPAAPAEKVNPAIGKVTKNCPKCTVEIEKIGGCNRMTCKCGHHFCWLCLAENKDYSHFCGRDPNQRRRRVARVQVDQDYINQTLTASQTVAETPQILQQLQKLQTYAHYYNRYHAHNHGQHFAETQCPCLENRVKNYTQMAGFQSGAEVDFIHSANETLVASRRLLKYTYCSAFHLQNGGDQNKESFLNIQLERLERFTEELSELSENALSRKDRTRVIDLISVVTKTMGALADFET